MKIRIEKDPMKQYVLEVERAKGLDVDILMDTISPKDAIPLSDLSVTDLSIYPGVGIYLMFNMANTPMYIGSTVSLNFFERLADHLDGRKHNYKATLTKRIAKKLESTEVDNSFCVGLAVQSLKIFFVNFTYDYFIPVNSEESKTESNFVREIEHNLITKLRPKLNMNIYKSLTREELTRLLQTPQ